MDMMFDAEAGGKMMFEYTTEIARLREENNQMRYQKEVRERDFENVMLENQTLYAKLDNLEYVFIGGPGPRKSGLDSERAAALQTRYSESNLAAENDDLRRRCAMLE